MGGASGGSPTPQSQGCSVKERCVNHVSCEGYCTCVHTVEFRQVARKAPAVGKLVCAALRTLWEHVEGVLLILGGVVLHGSHAAER